MTKEEIIKMMKTVEYDENSLSKEEIEKLKEVTKLWIRKLEKENKDE